MQLHSVTVTRTQLGLSGLSDGYDPVVCNKSKPRNLPGPKLTPKKSHAEFPSLKNFQKTLSVKTAPRQVWFSCTLCAK